MEPPRTPSAERRRREEERIKEEEERAKREAEEKRQAIMSRLIFHDFDYVNPYTSVPEGDTLENVEMRQQMLMQSSMNQSGFNMFGSKNHSSPGKSVYKCSDGDEMLGMSARLGGVKTNLRALKNVKPMVKNDEHSPGMRRVMKDRFQSLEPKTKKWGSPAKLPKIKGASRN